MSSEGRLRAEENARERGCQKFATRQAQITSRRIACCTMGGECYSIIPCWTYAYFRLLMQTRDNVFCRRGAACRMQWQNTAIILGSRSQKFAIPENEIYACALSGCPVTMLRREGTCCRCTIVSAKILLTANMFVHHLWYNVQTARAR